MVKGGRCSTFVKVLVDKEKTFQTDVISSNNAPIWNADVSFHIQKGKEVIEVMVMYKNSGKNELIGSLSLDLNTLRD